MTAALEAIRDGDLTRAPGDLENMIAILILTAVFSTPFIADYLVQAIRVRTDVEPVDADRAAARG